MTLSLLEFAQKCLQEVDHDFFTLFDLKQGEDASFSTYPKEWCTRYLSQKYYEHDYVFLKHLYLPVIWGEQISKNVPTAQKQIFKEAQDFNIYKGITVPFLTPNLREFITIAFNKKDKISSNKLLCLSSELHIACQMIFTYKHILESDSDSQAEALQFIEEVENWQKGSMKQKKKRSNAIEEALSDIRVSQLFITHHETKELGLETLHRAYKDIERLA
jgi:hypothetical protein